jgi:hypothetical protein
MGRQDKAVLFDAEFIFLEMEVDLSWGVDRI